MQVRHMKVIEVQEGRDETGGERGREDRWTEERTDKKIILNSRQSLMFCVPL